MRHMFVHRTSAYKNQPKLNQNPLDSHPVMRHMFLHFPGDPVAATLDQQARALSLLFPYTLTFFHIFFSIPASLGLIPPFRYYLDPPLPQPPPKS